MQYVDSSALLKLYVAEPDSPQAAALLAELTGARSLDALHLAAAQRAGAPAVRLVAVDLRLAQVARSLGWTVAGA